MSPSGVRLAMGVRRWWPLPAIVAAAFLAQNLVLEGRYDVGGHAAEHLRSATAPFFAAATVVIMLWVTPLAHRQIDVLVGCAAWLSATVLVLVGNLRVVDSLVDAGLAKAPAEGLPDVADHSLANLAPWLGVAAAVATAAAMWCRGHVGPRVALGAGIVSVLFPPWVIPGAGMPVLAIARCVARAKAHRTTGLDEDIREEPAGRARAPEAEL